MRGARRHFRVGVVLGHDIRASCVLRDSHMIPYSPVSRVFGQAGKDITFVHDLSIYLRLSLSLNGVVIFSGCRNLGRIEKTDCLGSVAIVVAHWTDRAIHCFAFNCTKKLSFREDWVHGLVIEVWLLRQTLDGLLLRAVYHVAWGITESCFSSL